MANNLPYSYSAATLEKLLLKIKTASVPERFTQDFISTKLAMKGGTAKGCIPIIKKMGFVAGDGSPTELYKEYRNPNKSQVAVAKAFKKLYARLYEMNEYVHDADDADVLGLIVECTGSKKSSTTTKYTLATFNMLRKLADFNVTQETDEIVSEEEEAIASSTDGSTNIQIHQNPPQQFNPPPPSGKRVNLSYTINLNLPPTKDIEVFNAIFKSLKQHILEG